MSNEILMLMITAATIGTVHTALGPDHYLPFIVMSKSGKWSTTKTIAVTTLCGLGHIGSSVLLGLIGVIFGVGLSKLEMFESIRGDWAAWAFVIFGIGYLGWSIYRLAKNKDHNHNHLTHSHEDSTKKMTPWLLFVVFALGPCEPLIPILMYPAAKSSTLGLVAVTSVFAITTIAVMLGVVLSVNFGTSLFRFKKLEKYTHVIAGLTILLSGLLILLGL
jgi:sulfite exporter TauE/SafE